MMRRLPLGSSMTTTTPANDRTRYHSIPHTAPPSVPPLHPQYRQAHSNGMHSMVNHDSRELIVRPPMVTNDSNNRAKSNSERGKEFRAKRKKYEAQLETNVFKLRAHVSELAMKKGVWEKQILEARHTDSGSLVRLINEYFALFRYGLRTPDLPTDTVTGNKRALVVTSLPDSSFMDQIRRQEEFIARVMDEAAMVGDMTGPAASLAQWRMYTLSHDSLRNEPYAISACGTDEHPCVEVRSNIYGRISMNTFRYMFPGAMNNQQLVQRFLHRDIVYKSIFRFQFTDDGKIAIESADIGIVEGLQEAGFGLEEISELMQQTVVTPECIIPAPIEISSPMSSTSSTSSHSPPRSTGPSDRISPSNSKLSLNYLLKSPTDELRPDERVQVMES